MDGHETSLTPTCDTTTDDTTDDTDTGTDTDSVTCGLAGSDGLWTGYDWNDGEVCVNNGLLYGATTASERMIIATRSLSSAPSDYLT